MSDDIFDFGFTAVTEEELDVVTELSARAETALENHERLNALYNAIQPLLNNLKANPEKDYIYWPNRLEKVEAFSDLLDNIYKG
jgi:tRNA(Phe) wybutosine-synthesizing methylase Tyw3